VTGSGVEDVLDRAAVAAVDSESLLGDVEAQPHQLEDALWRVESAGIATGERRGGLLVCGMGGSAIGGDLAAAAVGRRARAQLQTVRGYGLPPGAPADGLVLCASYSGETEETLASFTEAGAAGIERVVITTGGRLAAAARAEGVPVIGVPGGMRPRAAIIYMLVGALECAALCGAAASLRSEVEAASALLARLALDWGPGASEVALPKRLARLLKGRVPVIYGVGATAPAALRWKTQINENAELPAFSAALPEAGHNELSGWKGATELGPFAAVFLDDAGAGARVRRHLKLMAAEVGGLASVLEQIPSFGGTALERVTAAVMLGDFTSVYLAVLRGVDPTPAEAIERLKQAVREDAGAAGAHTK